MGISHYIKEIGRGARGARSLDRDQARDLFGQVLDGTVTDLEIGAFCLAMRIKGETPAEMAGFLDATHERMARFSSGRLTVVLPSYNGARKLPVLTPLLGCLLAREGHAVLLHGTQTETRRVTSSSVLEAMGIAAALDVQALRAGELVHVDTGVLSPGLKRLLAVRQVVGLRNPAHSVVKLMQPALGGNLVLSSYTHPAYLDSMNQTFALLDMHALLSRGLEGESAADPRRTAQVDGYVHGQRIELQAQAAGTLDEVPGLPEAIDADTTARYTQDVLDGRLPVPLAIARQIEHVARLCALIEAGRDSAEASQPQLAATMALDP
ncbi:DNA-binding protein YbiB [Variovorax dokdonensis]|uniref:DNA-binding protein YbiB n=1 Tax=Variovorax dokdonensis TaxID=344883 RepID=A0ABT7NF45_9BURK|nr:DNA-binding protein YbiB [Variovorax dokdonensis]MDM0046445.1 DNA-binding protein YbiB [Variovorax dokdonensis]